MKKKIIALLMVCATLVFGLIQPASAIEPLELETIDMGNDLDRYSSMISPDHIYPFIYEGSAPYMSVEIDTSSCTVGRLYVYDQVANTLTEVFDGSVVEYEETDSYLYFVSKNQVLYRADYEDFEVQTIYEAQDGSVSSVTTYYQLVCFVENGNTVRFVDTLVGLTDAIEFEEDICSVFLLNPREFVVATSAGIDYYYNRTESGSMRQICDMESVYLINQAVMPEGLPSTPADASLMSLFLTSNLTQSNDVSLPLSQYPVRPVDNDDYSNFTVQEPFSWFHDNGLEGCSSSNCLSYAGTNECEGFGRLAHDAYLHITDYSIGYGEWLTSKHSASLTLSGTSVISNFFNSLNSGAYIRYLTKNGYYHSVVFLYTEGSGVWVYECNQAYDKDPNHGCGIQVQYYTFSKIDEQYPSVLHYVNHNFTDAKQYYNSNYHNVGCPDCDGFVRQAHSGGYSYTYSSTSKHIKNRACCSGYSVTENHFPSSTTLLSSTRHTLKFTCCNRSVNANHTTGSTITYTPISDSHHSVSRGCCSGSYTEEHTFNGMNICIYCNHMYYSLRPSES